MDMLSENVKRIYFKYLTAAFGSALISSIYGIVDMAMVGQYQGPSGTAALAVVAPIWNIIYSLGLLTGIGGSVLLGSAKGKGETKEQNEYFSAALICTIIIAVVCWGAVLFFDTEMLTLFGAEETLLPLAKEYLVPIKFVVPAFLFN
ncbi:MAG: multidrug transporter MatE, partial [Lachnospiraceae bacterium]|nr:multidrug transporter MatE [Lachnospiraceae bacterium]